MGSRVRVPSRPQILVEAFLNGKAFFVFGLTTKAKMYAKCTKLIKNFANLALYLANLSVKFIPAKITWCMKFIPLYGLIVLIILIACNQHLR